jgi:hypothetical protein
MMARWLTRALAVPLFLISCSALAAGAFWIPFSATPQTGSKSGKSGLFVVSSSAVGTLPAPSPTWITTAEPTILGVAFTGYPGSPAATSLTPDLLMYSAQGADGKLHVYGLSLANPSGSKTPPKPVQISNLAIPTSQAICGAGEVETNGSEPTSLAVVIHVATPEAGSKPGSQGYCAAVPSGKYYLVPYTDSATTAPTLLSIPGGTSTLSAIVNDGAFVPLNLKSGLLGGIVYWDSATRDENFYASPLFTKPEVALGGVTGTPLACVNVGAVTNGEENLLAGEYLATASTAKGFGSYEFTPAGAAHEFFAGQAAGCVTDSTNLYFIGTPSGSSTASIYQEAASSLTSAQMLLSGVSTSETQMFSLIGSNGVVLAFQENSIASLGITTSVKTVPLGVSSKTAKTIGGPFAGSLLSGFLATPRGETAGDDWLFLTEISETVSAGKPVVAYASQVLDPTTGTSVLPASTHSVWQAFGAFTGELDGTVLEISGITDTDGGYGGGSLELVLVGSTTSPGKITLTGGATYKVPATYLLSLTGFYGTPIATGGLVSVSGGLSVGAVVNVTDKVIVPISVADTNVLPLL